MLERQICDHVSNERISSYAVLTVCYVDNVVAKIAVSSQKPRIESSGSRERKLQSRVDWLVVTRLDLATTARIRQV